MSDIDLDAIEARARDWRDYRAGKELVLALIARVREQEQEIARLTRERDERPTPEAMHALIGGAATGEDLHTIAVLVGLQRTVAEYCARLAWETRPAAAEATRA